MFFWTDDMSVALFSSASEKLSNISCATNPYQLAAKLTFFWTDDKSVPFFLRFARHPADSDGLPNRWCPGTGQGTKGTIRTTLGQHCTAECRLALRAVISPKAIRHFFAVVEHNWCDLAFDWSCCLVLITLKAQVANQTGLAEAVRAINNLATAQVRKDTPSLIDAKGLVRPMEFSLAREELFSSDRRTRKRSLLE